MGEAIWLGAYNFVLVPEFTYFGHDNALSVNVGVPIHLPVAGYEGGFGEVFKEGWDKPRDFTKIIRGIKFGQKESDFYVELSRTLSGTLGHGQLMRFLLRTLAPVFFLNTRFRPMLSHWLLTDILVLAVLSFFSMTSSCLAFLVGCFFFDRPCWPVRRVKF